MLSRRIVPTNRHGVESISEPCDAIAPVGTVDRPRAPAVGNTGGEKEARRDENAARGRTGMAPSVPVAARRPGLAIAGAAQAASFPPRRPCYWSRSPRQSLDSHAQLFQPGPDRTAALDLVPARCTRRGARRNAASNGRSRTGFACSWPSRLPTARRGGARRRHSGGGTPPRPRERRPRLGARHGRASLRRPQRPAAGVLRPGRQRGIYAPREHRVSVVLARPLPPNEGCVWSFDDGEGPARRVGAACDEEVNARVPFGRSPLSASTSCCPTPLPSASSVRSRCAMC